jgi:hypothetical protein
MGFCAIDVKIFNVNVLKKDIKVVLLTKVKMNLITYL